MSRSNPTDQSSHPCSRWYEWSGEAGGIRYYDKATKKNIEVSGDFTFIVLDQLAVVKGWHDASDSGITSNEVRDTTTDIMVVKAFKGGILCSGIYQSIKDRVNAVGGHYTANIYIAYRDGAILKIGSLQLKGAALNSWVEFKNANRAELFSKAVRIGGYNEGKKGNIVFRTPKFFLVDVTKDTNEKALALDVELQKYLDRYLSKPKQEQAETNAATVPDPSENDAHANGADPVSEKPLPKIDDYPDVPF